MKSAEIERLQKKADRLALSEEAGQVIKNDIAMTGEITLTGKVLPIGGAREKTIAAKRVGIRELIFPKENQKDFEELPDYIREGIRVHYANFFEDVLGVAYGNNEFS
ncbi:MAG: hypothetical protein HC880_18140 [Bacteroidia bacterium]|nr:hypothetical protein [Bacteroidia bacterium]